VAADPDSAAPVEPDADDSVSVIICTYTAARWEWLVAAVESVRAQTVGPVEVLVIVDGDEELARRAQQRFPNARVHMNEYEPGLSGGRRTGAEHARGAILAFLDDDAVADADWLEQLRPAFDDPRVLGAGGLVEPAWERPPPNWFPPEFNWVVGCSWHGLPTDATQIRNPIGANMSVRASVLAAAGAFDPRLGRAPYGDKLGGAAEETEFCIRAAAAHPGHYWVYRPSSRVRHSVRPDRTTLRYFVRRCVIEGEAKALLVDITGSDQALRTERDYVRSVLPRAFVRDLRGAMRGHPGQLGRATAIFAGVTITVTSYVWTRLALRMSRRGR
jgi:glycosyltransferase involved in cell wall biosynthesis